MQMKQRKTSRRLWKGSGDQLLELRVHVAVRSLVSELELELRSRNSNCGPERLRLVADGREELRKLISHQNRYHDHNS